MLHLLLMLPEKCVILANYFFSYCALEARLSSSCHRENFSWCSVLNVSQKSKCR